MRLTPNNTPKRPKRVRNHVNPLADQSVLEFAGFGNTRPIMIDIGAYRGEFAEQLVAHFSLTHNFIVTEIRKPYAMYLRELFADQKEVEVFDGDSSKNITGLLKTSIESGAQVEYIFINFPDPWFKEKHKKRRVLNESFLDQIIQLGCTDTQIIFQTDQKPLFNETVEVIEEHGAYNISYFEKPLWDIQSYWETMKIGEGDAIYRMSIQLKK